MNKTITKSLRAELRMQLTKLLSKHDLENVDKKIQSKKDFKLSNLLIVKISELNNILSGASND